MKNVMRSWSRRALDENAREQVMCNRTRDPAIANFQFPGDSVWHVLDFTVGVAWPLHAAVRER